MPELLPGISEWKLIALLLEGIRKTEADEQVISYVANQIKTQIPENEIEPIIGELLIELGNQLKETTNN